MPALFEINDKYRAVLIEQDEYAEDHDGDVTDFPLAEKLAALEGDLQTKILNICCLFKELAADGKAIKDLGESLVKRGQAKINRAERLKKYVSDNLPTNAAYEDNRAAVKWYGNGGVLPVELMPEVRPENLPGKYQRLIVEVNVDAIREDAMLDPDSALSDGYPCIMDGDKVLAVVKPRGKHIRIK